MEPYNPADIEGKWQQRWEEQGLANVDTANPADPFYMLMMFPYPSGDLHVGHGRNYILGDALFRLFLMKGMRALNPMGWDAFGLPAENAAIRHGIHPREWTLANIQRMKRQFRRWGILYDWTKEIASCEPEYYRWNQWLFIKLLERGLAYRAHRAVNWCPSCTTVLANEQVQQGACERCGSPVVQRELEQWFLRITEYADRLLEGLDRLDKWPERVKVMQRNWIGRSTGCDVEFSVEGTGERFTVYTTRVDTIYGATFVALAPEHPLVPRLIAEAPDRAEIEAFVERMRSASRLQREAEGAEKEGYFTGSYAINPFSGERIPIWIANFVLMDYGTGAIMSVPAHDQRDYEFATKYGIPVRLVIQGEGMDPGAKLEAAHEGPGVLVNSGPFDGLDWEEAKERMAEYAEEKGFGKRQVRYRLRDWLISRQRYWGTPIPVIYCEDCGAVPVPETDLPVELPTDIDFRGVKGNPLEHSSSFVETTCPRCGRAARRETDTMDTFVDSSWYYLRFINPEVHDAMFDVERARHWMPVDLYIGGIEHATMHLIYARFIYKVLFDMGLVPNDEPFTELFNQGMIYKEGYRDPTQNMAWVPRDEIEFVDGPGDVRRALRKGSGAELVPENAKMSKSKFNVVPPDELIERYGADTERVYTLFIGPPERDAEWRDEAVAGAHRFLSRVWSLLEKVQGDGGREKDSELEVATHRTIKKVSEDVQRYHLNTAVASLMEFLNVLSAAADRGSAAAGQLRESYETLLRLLHPFAPHITEELWQRLGHGEPIVKSGWPEWNRDLLAAQAVTIAVQVNGKLRGQVDVEPDADREAVEAAARANPSVARWLEGKNIVKVIVVPGRLVNFVVR